MLERSVDSAFYQISHGAELLRENLGVVPRLFRPPFGEFNVTVSAPARAEGMEVCLWTIDSHDWDEEYTQEQVIKRVKKDVGPGTIILFHLDGFFTPQVLREVIPYYQNELGLTQIPVTQLMEISGRELPTSPYITEEEPIIEEEPAIEVEESAPVIEEPAPVVEEPAPVVEEPAPVVEEPAPVVEEPAPVIEEPAPVVEEPAPIVEEPIIVEAIPALEPEAEKLPTDPAGIVPEVLPLAE